MKKKDVNKKTATKKQLQDPEVDRPRTCPQRCDLVPWEVWMSIFWHGECDGVMHWHPMSMGNPWQNVSTYICGWVFRTSSINQRMMFSSENTFNLTKEKQNFRT